MELSLYALCPILPNHLLQNQFIINLCLSLILLISLLLLLFQRSNQNKSSDGEALKLPPTPPRFPVIGNLHQLGRSPHRSLRALSDKYGPLMLLHLGHSPTLVVSSPDLVKEIVKNHDVVFSDRPKTTATDVLFYGAKNVGFCSYGEYWRQARKICALQLLSHQRVQSFQPVRDDEVSAMIETIRKASQSGVSINLSKILISTSNNIVLRCILGKSYNDEDEEDDEEVGGGSTVGRLSRTVATQLMAFSVGDFFPCLRWIDFVRGFTGSLKKTIRALDAFYDQVFEEHKAMMKNQDDPKDFVDILLQVQKDRSLEFTNDHVKAILQDMLIGGIDTTSTIMEWLMAELLRNPRVMKKVQTEVRRVVGARTKIDMDDINRMDYLKCVFKENIRLHLPVPFFIPRETSRSVQIGGYHVPAGTKVIINGCAIHMDPSSWDRPEEFIPERFENCPFDYKSREYFQFMPFGFGRRQCPGMAFGIITMEYVIANLLYWFDWKLLCTGEGDSPQDLDMSEVYGISVHKKNPIHAFPVQYSP